jgi:predicted SprT family Zn-dependent metalloprotease
MTKQECQWLCEQTWEEFKQIKEFAHFPKVDVVFDLSQDANKSFGQCQKFRNKPLNIIKIYKTHYENGKFDDVFNTIVHELCHAVDYQFSKHGKFWQHIARIAGQHFGTVIKRCASFDQDEIEVRKQKAIADLTCNACGKQYLIFKRSGAFIYQGKGYRCGKCKGSLTFTNFGKVKTKIQFA